MRNILSLLVLLSTANVTFAVDKIDFNLLKVNKNDFFLIQSPPPPKKDVLPIKKEERKVGDVYKDEQGYWRKKADDGKGDWYWDGRNWYRIISQTSKIENCPLNT
jgi:hypothetical protein